MEENLISVIIPVYNVEPYLNRCVESVVNQTYKNLEIILVDDGSPDNCPVMCDEWAKKDNRIKVIHKENGGVASARNAGLDTATGELVGWVDSDDWIDEDYFSVLHDKLIKYDADIAYNRNNEGAKTEKMLVGEKILSTFMLNRLSSTLWTTLTYMKLFEGERFSDFEISEDTDMLGRIYEKCSLIVSYNQGGYHYLTRSSSALHSTNLEKMKNWLKVSIYIAERVESRHPSLSNVCAFRKLRDTNVIYHDTKNFEKTDELMEFWEELRKIIRQNVFKVPYYLLDFQQIKSVLSAIKFSLKL